MAGLSSLAWPSLFGLLGWVRLQTCCTLSNQCETCLNPPPPPHKHALKVELSCRAAEHQVMVVYCDFYHEPDFNTNTLLFEGAQKGQLGGGSSSDLVRRKGFKVYVFLKTLQIVA
ncbi:unnamed protein product [Arctogadus glacialis]